MDFGTLLVGMLIAYRYKYPFLFMPIAFVILQTAMDSSAFFYGDDFGWNIGRFVLFYIGAAMTLLAFWVDYQYYKKADYAFWIYLFGVTAFWFGLTLLDANHALFKFVYFCTNLLLIVVGTIVRRKIFVFFGALGSLYYLGHLAFRIFKQEWMFPIALTAIGLAIIYLGILWQKHQNKLSNKLRARLPNKLKQWLETKA